MVLVSDLLPADEEIGEQGSGVRHPSALKGVKATALYLSPPARCPE
jgi:hypothetical protein